MYKFALHRQVSVPKTAYKLFAVIACFYSAPAQAESPADSPLIAPANDQLGAEQQGAEPAEQQGAEPAEQQGAEPAEQQGAELAEQQGAEPAQQQTVDPIERQAAEPEYWAGKLTVTGYRKVPILGKIEFQTSNHIIAEVTRQGDTIHIKQEVCTVEFEKVLGAQLYMDPKAPPRMRSVNPVFHPQENGVLQSTIWPSGWSTQDLDEDGFPGITITVKAPLCGGQMYMGSEAQSIARLKPWNGALAGLVQVQVKQFVLGTRGACLSLMARDHTQTLPGFLIYSPLDQRYSCDDLAGHTWPEYDAENWPLGASDMQDLANYFQSQVD